jgi:hypothetical protein
VAISPKCSVTIANTGNRVSGSDRRAALQGRHRHVEHRQMVGAAGEPWRPADHGIDRLEFLDSHRAAGQALRGSTACAGLWTRVVHDRPTDKRAPSSIPFWTGYNHSLKRHLPVCVPAAHLQQITRAGCSHRRRGRDRRTGPAEAHAPLFRLFYQVEIRHLPNPLIEKALTRSQLLVPTTSKTRLWQLLGCYLEIARLRASFW